jgi:integrase/recombinase XerC
MLDAGLRVGELCKIKISDLMFNGGTVRNLVVRKEIAKGHRERTIPVSVRLQAAICIYADDLWSPEDYHDDNFAFHGQGILENITPRQVQRIIGKLSKKGIGRRIHPHVLRHTFATRLMRVTNSRIVQTLLGHVNLQTTQRYTHPNNHDLSEAIEKI